TPSPTRTSSPSSASAPPERARPRGATAARGGRPRSNALARRGRSGHVLCAHRASRPPPPPPGRLAPRPPLAPAPHHPVAIPIPPQETLIRGRQRLRPRHPSVPVQIPPPEPRTQRGGAGAAARAPLERLRQLGPAQPPIAVPIRPREAPGWQRQLRARQTT